MTAHWRGRDLTLSAMSGSSGEIDKTDGMLLMFDSPSDAVHYALAYHQALARLPIALKARAGLHVGPVSLRENSPEDVAHGAKPLEVEGLAKPTAARVMAPARGWQTLISDEARKALVEVRGPCSRTATGCSRALRSRSSCARSVRTQTRSLRHPTAIKPKERAFGAAGGNLVKAGQITRSRGD